MHKDVPADPQYLRPKHAARYFGIGVSTLWLWLKTRPGFPPAIKAGPRTTLIDVPATAAFLLLDSEKHK
jgi:predicted DNA-binding transcriptional regulator AlpA